MEYINPLPCSPALAASIDAFKAKRVVWSAIVFIIFIISLEFSLFLTTSVVWSWMLCIKSDTSENVRIANISSDISARVSQVAKDILDDVNSKQF